MVQDQGLETVCGPSTKTGAWMGSEVGRGVGGYLAGVRAGSPFAPVVGVVAFSLGVFARSLGWEVIAPIVFSVATFSITAQFAVAAVLDAGGHLTIDEKALEVGMAVVASALAAPVLLAVVLAAVVTAFARLFPG
jgi:hypothetical protein